MDTSYPREERPRPKRGSPPAAPQAPRDHLLWAIFNTLYMNFCCLGFVALAFAVKARDRKVSGDVEAARHFSSKARCYNALATAGSVVLPLLLGALIVTGVIHLSKLAQDSVVFFTYQLSGSDDEDQ